jgi:serine/threonine-protein kinase RsbW
MRSIAFPGKFSSLDDIRDFYTEAAKEAELDKKSIYDVQLAVDEAASNIIDHAYEGEGKGEIECSYQVSPGKLEVVMRDRGKAFNPKTVKKPNLKANLNNRKQGGLGLHFMRSLMDSVEFTFNGQSGNVLRMVKTNKQSKEQSEQKTERQE